MKVIKDGLSEKLNLLFLNWIKEHETNIQHDIQDDFAWNELVQYLMELERESAA